MSFLVILVVICYFSGGLFHSVTAANETSGTSSGRQKESKTNDTYYERNPDSIVNASSTFGSGYNTSSSSTNLTFSPTPFGIGDYLYNDTNATDINATSTWSPSPTPFNGTVVYSPSSLPLSPFPLIGFNSTTNSSNIWNKTNRTGSTNTTNGTDTSDISSSTFSNETKGGDFNSSSPPSEYDWNETATNNETSSSSYYNETSESTLSSEPWDLDNTTTTRNTTLVPTPAVTTDMMQQGDTKKMNATTSPSPTNTPTAVTTVPYPKFDGHQFQPNANDDTQEEEEEEVTFTAYDYDTDDAGTSESNSMIYSSSATSDDNIQQSNITKTVAIVLACVLITAFTAWEIQRNPHGFCANLTYCLASVIWYLISAPILFLWRFALNRATRRSTYHDADYFQEGTFQTTSRRGDQDLRYQPRSSRYIPRDLELS